MPHRKKMKRRAQSRPPEGVEGEEPQAGADRAASGRIPKGWFALFIGTAVAVLIVFVLALVALSRSGGQAVEEPAVIPNTGHRAAIVDQLSLTQPNPTFVEAATEILKESGYAVDYHPGEEVTVEFYRTFPAQPYDLIIYRVHSALGREDGKPVDWVTLFTSDSYHESWYVDEQKNRRLSKVSYYENGPPYFGIMPAFVQSSMKGDLKGSTVVLMGCDGLATETIAKALVDKGAKAVVSWNGLVTGNHTDAAAEQLLRYLAEGLPLKEAVEKTAAEIGPDPAYGSVLRLYPPEGG